MKMRLVFCTLILCNLQPPCALAQEPPPINPDETGGAAHQPAAHQPAAPVPAIGIRYKPPFRGAPATRVGGASRGTTDKDLVLSVLAPEQTGLTTSAQPTLYWYMSKAVTMPMEFTLNDEQTGHTLLKQPVKLEAPVRLGIQHLRLSNYSLKTGVEYRWFIALVPDMGQRSHDIIAGGTIQYVQPPAALEGRLKHANRREMPAIYAAQGFWYDAIASISELIDTNPGDKSLREQRAALLEQVGLTAAAAYDRHAVGP